MGTTSNQICALVGCNATEWQLFTFVSGQPVAPIIKAQRVQEEWVITNLKDFNFLTRPLATAAVVPTASERQNNTLPALYQSNEQYGGIVVSQVSIPRPLTHSVNPSFSWSCHPYQQRSASPRYWKCSWERARLGLICRHCS